MNRIIVNNQQILLDQDGFLQNKAEWTAEIATALAEKAGIVLTAQHWEIIYAVKNFYNEYDMSPNQRPFVKYIAKTLGQDKGTSRYLLRLFPGSPAKLASLIAGLPKPDHCF